MQGCPHRARCSKGPENLPNFHSLSPRIKGLKTLLNGSDELFVVGPRKVLLLSYVLLYFYIFFFEKDREVRLVRAVRGLLVVVRSHIGRASLLSLALMVSLLETKLLSASTRSILADGPFQQTLVS